MEQPYTFNKFIFLHIYSIVIPFVKYHRLKCCDGLKIYQQKKHRSNKNTVFKVPKRCVKEETVQLD